MGNHSLPFNLKKKHVQSRYSQIDHKCNFEQSFEESQIDEWDSSWKEVTHENIYYRVEYGKVHTFRNDVTSEEVQRYRIVLNDRKDFEKWKQIVHWRNKSQYLVKIQHFSLKNKGEVCVSQFQINLFIERIPLRLVDLTDIPYPQNLYFLLCVIKGFKHIFSSPFPIKSFKVTQSMICVNKQGQVKVWLSPNLSDFEPINQKNTQYSTQQDILRNLIDLVQQNTDQRDYPYPFRQYLSDKNILINGDYNSIIQQIYTYAKDMKFTIPKYAFSVRDILSKEFLSNNKLESQNSFSHKPHFRNQNSSIRRDQSLSVLNSFDFQPQTKQKVDNRNQANDNKADFIHKQTTHGLTSTNNILHNYNFATTISEPPMINNTQQKDHNINKLMQNQPYHHFSNDTKLEQIRPELRPNIHLLNDHNFSTKSPNGHLMRINKIGNNIIQYHQPDFSYHPPSHQPNLSHENKLFRQAHSLEKPPNPNQNVNIPRPPPSGYRIVQRKNVHAVGFNPLNTKLQPNFNSLLNTRIFHAQIEPRSYHIPQNQSFQNIERVNSTSISFPIVKASYTSEFNQRPQSIEKDSYVSLTQTKRPEQISSKIQIERINRQSSHKTFNSNENSQENMRKTNSFKNNLIKNQDEGKYVERIVSNVKYFTKKDSQQTLDHQIAGDLMKYLGQKP